VLCGEWTRCCKSFSRFLNEMVMPDRGRGGDPWRRPGLVQVAGIRNLEEARMLLDAGVHLLGFPLRLAVHSEDVSDDEAAHIISALKVEHKTVLITYLSQPGEIASLAERLGARVVQLHGDVSCSAVAELKQSLPGLFVIKSLIVSRSNVGELLRLMRSFDKLADAYIADTFDPETGACGATGKTHDWSISRDLVRESRRPVLLAGGLTPENVRRAILEVKPFGVDAHTGLERSDGSKDPVKVKAFVSEAQAGFADLSR
jgi:phosphoribosylanthranilate isomerase